MRTAVLVDRHPLWLDTLEAVVTGVGVTVLGKFTSAAAALAEIPRREPDLLVTDVDMPVGEVDGIELVRSARELVPSLQAVVLSSSCDQARVEAAFRAGARAYVIKTAHADVIAAAVRQAFESSIFLAGQANGLEGEPAAVVPIDKRRTLTRRERQILQLVAEGHSNAELARMLWVTEQTIKFHLSNVYRKLEVSNRTEASRWAQRAGLLGSSSAAA